MEAVGAAIFQAGVMIMGTFTVRVNNPIVDTEVMVIQTDSEAIALSEAAYYSRRHGVARVYDDSLNREVARFRYGVEEASANGQ